MSRNKLIDLRENNNKKSTDIAKHLHVTKSAYSEWENDKTPIPTVRLINISDYYDGISIDYILNLTSNKIYYKRKTKIDLILIGKRLKLIRNELKLTLRELEKKINCSFSSIASYERGERLIVSYALVNLAKLGNYSIDWILGRSKEKYIK